MFCAILGAMRALKRVLVALLVMAFVLVGLPFVIPVPPLQGTVAPEELADPDSRFVTVHGLQVHYKLRGDRKSVV